MLQAPVVHYPTDNYGWIWAKIRNFPHLLTKRMGAYILDVTSKGMGGKISDHKLGV